MKGNKFIGEGLKISGPNLNVINVLRALVEDKGSEVYIPQEYKRGTLSKSHDPRVHFQPIESGRNIKVMDIKSNQERYNFSLVGLVDVLVEYTSDDGKVELKNKKVWRQYNIIRDGKLTMDYIICNLSPEAFEKLRDAGILWYNGIKVAPNHQFSEGFLYKVSLKDIPLISLCWAQPVNIGLYEYMTKEANMSAKLKAVNSLIKEFKKTLIFPDKDESDSEIYTEAYAPVEKDDREVATYSAECLTYTLDVEVAEDSSNVSDLLSYEQAVQLKKEINSKLSDIRFIIRCIIYAIESSSKKGSYNWSDLEPVPRSKNKMRQYANIDINGKSMKLCRTVWEKQVEYECLQSF